MSYLDSCVTWVKNFVSFSVLKGAFLQWAHSREADRQCGESERGGLHETKVPERFRIEVYMVRAPRPSLHPVWCINKWNTDHCIEQPVDNWASFFSILGLKLQLLVLLIIDSSVKYCLQLTMNCFVLKMLQNSEKCQFPVSKVTISCFFKTAKMSDIKEKKDLQILTLEKLKPANVSFFLLDKWQQKAM